MWDGCYKVLKSLTSELATTLKRVENDTRMDKSKHLEDKDNDKFH